MQTFGEVKSLLLPGGRFLSSPSLLPAGPGPVSDFRVTTVSTRGIGLAWSSKDSDSFKILIRQDGAGIPRTESANGNSTFIGDLYPGTKYCFEIFPLGPNGTEGDSQNICNTTGKQRGCVSCETMMFLQGNQYNV